MAARKMIFRGVDDIREHMPPENVAKLNAVRWWPPRNGSVDGAPRIGFLSCSYLPIGGTETFHRTLIPALRDRVNIGGFVSTGISGGDGQRLKVNYATGIESARLLAAHCDVVVSWGIPNLETLLPATRPKVIAVHHADFTHEWSNRTILDQLPVVDSVVCVNEATAKRLSEHGKPTHFIANAIDPQRIIATGNQFGLRFQFDIAQDSKIVLFGHRLSSEKRPLLAVTIAKHLPADWTMVIVGDGPERESIERMAAGCDRVRFVGPSDSLADWLSISDCFLSLSTFEGFGLSIAEAIASGVPTVSTPTGIAPRHATTLPIDSTASEWAEAILTANVITPAETILERFSVARMVDQWAELLNSSL